MLSRRTGSRLGRGPSTAARADRIAVLGQGRIVETGSRPELLAAYGSYAALWDAFTGESGLVA